MAPDDQPLPSPASQAQWTADFQRVPADLTRACRKLTWGVLKIDAPPPPPDPNSPPPSDPPPFPAPRSDTVPSTATAPPAPTPVIRAAALLPDGRTAAITAWPAPPAPDAPPPPDAHPDAHPNTPSQIIVTIRIGHFGDPDLERQFLNTLARTLAGKPMPKRDKTFQLPQ